MPTRRLVLIGSLLWPIAATAATLIEALRAGGLTLYFRHSLTVREGQPDNDLSRCDTQRNLSEAGRDAARDIGAAIRELDIPIGEVLSSPYCRCVDTATLAFSRVTAVPWLRTDAQFHTTAERNRLATLAQTLRTPPAGGNRVLVAHGYNLIGLHQVHGWERQGLQEAECVAFRAAETPAALGRVRHDGWRALAA